MDKQKIVSWVVGALVIAVVAINIVNFARPSHPLVGKEAPDFRLPRQDNQVTLQLSEQRGKVVILDFWATWCPPCRAQMPALQELADDERFQNDVLVISVNTDDEDQHRQRLVANFLVQNNLSMLTVMDNGSVRPLYRVRAIPTLVVIDRQGKVRHVSAGVHTTAQLRNLVRKAM
jgi:thiol-disulfide isomerase/thioredoxin